MAYGKLKVDTLVYDNNGTDQEFLVNSIDPATYVRLDANGNLGVGVANPSERLSVLGSATSASNLTNPLLIGNIGTHTNSGHKQGEGVSIGFQLKRGSDGATANTAFVKAEAEADLGSSWPTALTFGTQRFGSDPVEHVRIDSEGKVGIGGAAGGEQLLVRQSAVTNAPTRSAALYLENNANCEIQFVGNSSNDCQLRFGTSSNSFKGALEYELNNNNLLVYTDGSEKLRVDSTGRMLIGSSVSMHPDADDINVAGPGNIGLTFRCPTTAQGGIYFADGVNGHDRQRGMIVYDHSDNSLRLHANVGERIRINSSGNLGVGTTSPGNTLHLSGTNGVGMRIENTSNSISAYSTLESSGALQANISGAGVFSWVTGGSEKVRIDNAGNLGVGTSGPEKLLHVESSSSPTVYIKSDNATAGTFSQLEFGNGGGNTAAKSRIKSYRNSAASAATSLAFETTSSSSTTSERLRIDSQGRVGFGTSTIDEVLHVKSSDTNVRLKVQSTTANSYPGVRLTNDAKTYDLQIDGATDAFRVFDGSASTERMRIDSSGRLLVQATSAPTQGIYSQYAPLTVQGYIGSTTGNGILNVARGTTAANLSSGSDIGTVVFSDSAGGEFGRISCFADAAPGSNDYPGRISFHTTADGASSPTERMRINNFGRLSTFSDDGTAFIHASSKAAGTSDRLFEGRYGATGVNGGTKSFEIFTNGDVKNTNNVYAAISDVKLKENIVDANSQWDDFKAVRFRKYNFKEETGNETFTQLGVIAQELETVCPGLVTESPDFDEEGNDLGTTTKGVKYSILTNKALVALQEAMTRIETLEQRLAAAGL